MNSNKLNILFFISIHIVLGYLLNLPIIPILVVHSLYFVAFFHVIINKNRNQEALFWSMYFASAEVLFRMTNGLILYESVKYIILLLLFIGLIFEKQKKPFPLQYVIYLLLLMIGIAFTEIPAGESLRKTILFNLSGPFVLGVSAIYNYKLIISKDKIHQLIRWSLYPILSLIVYLFVKTPELSSIVFKTESSFSTSGGFGPNQVSTTLGFGVFALASLLIVRKRFSNVLPFDLIFLMYIFFRGLLTFSRGGIITAVIALIIFGIFYNIDSKKNIFNIIKYISIALIFLTSILIYTSNLTGGMLVNRYFVKSNENDYVSTLTSGRTDILESDFIFFKKNPIFGIGVGSGKFKRAEINDGQEIASHNEIGRLISEHGLIGIIILIILIIYPLFQIYSVNYYNKAWSIAFFIIWFLTINHSAMRLALPGFVYGLSLINIKKE